MIGVFDVDEGVYTTVGVEGRGVGAALDLFTDELGMRFPLAELLAEDLPQRLDDTLDEVTYVGLEELDGATWHHVAGRGDAVDLQAWIAADGPAVPGRIVLTYKAEPGQPQFRAALHDWDLDPSFPRDLFVFEPPQGAEKIRVIPAREGR